MLSKKVLDQINRFNRKDLGNIETPAPLGLVFKESSLVSPVTNNTLQWVKRFYILDRNNLGFLTKDYFNDTEKIIGYTVLSPTVDGGLIDKNIPQFSNIEYGVDVYSDINKSYLFKIICNAGANVAIYIKQKNLDVYTVSPITEGFRGGVISIDFPAKT